VWFCRRGCEVRTDGTRYSLTFKFQVVEALKAEGKEAEAQVAWAHGVCNSVSMQTLRLPKHDKLPGHISGVTRHGTACRCFRLGYRPPMEYFIRRICTRNGSRK